MNQISHRILRVNVSLCHWRVKTHVTPITNVPYKTSANMPTRAVTLGDNLWKRRQELGLGQMGATKVFRVGKASYQKWEEDVFWPRAGHLKQVIEFLGYGR